MRSGRPPCLQLPHALSTSHLLQSGLLAFMCGTKKGYVFICEGVWQRQGHTVITV